MINISFSSFFFLLLNKFYLRYGLLYLGYRDDRAWWELVVAFRKVAVVLIGTFGELLGVVDIQAHLALFIVFISIAAHLVGKPFDMTRKNSKLLYELELGALCICWFTFWGGLLFFLGDEKKNSVSPDVKILMTVTLVVANGAYLIIAFYFFGKEYMNDRKKAKQRKSTLLTSLSLVNIVPTGITIIKDNDTTTSNTTSTTTTPNTITTGTGEGKTTLTVANSAVRHRIPSIRRKLTHHLGNFGDHDVAREIHDNFHIHEEGLKQKTEQGQRRMKRKTQMRLKARTRLKDSKALHQLKVFKNLNDEQVEEIIDQMDHVTRFKGDPICHQHDISDSFYIIVKGSAIVTVDVKEKTDKGNEEKVEHEKKEMKHKEKEEDVDKDDEEEEARPEQLEVARIETLGFFGESKYK